MQVKHASVHSQGRMGCYSFNSVTTVDQLQVILMSVMWPTTTGPDGSPGEPMSLRQSLVNPEKKDSVYDLFNLRWVGKRFNRQGVLVWDDKWPGVGKWTRIGN